LIGFHAVVAIICLIPVHYILLLLSFFPVYFFNPMSLRRQNDLDALTQQIQHELQTRHDDALVKVFIAADEQPRVANGRTLLYAQIEVFIEERIEERTEHHLQSNDDDTHNQVPITTATPPIAVN
jgi:chloramphenicol O-acetyltransferase